jgi:hypothetical protein
MNIISGYGFSQVKDHPIPSITLHPRYAGKLHLNLAFMRSERCGVQGVQVSKCSRALQL